eukprot:CAMPEP_0116069960 /NCGR_PEP_ID=MMETSP0322-20121206/12666_1 /TAXON_ID=163516 /ORGANISM="Leptocylindrus danicus var. apora, Strain B651" /LENGTH=143 /DNA_ID=CAMNT_0003557559 /DNA_START=167 /DNA_END=598 /DNA_ORIENTATION=-
MCSSSFLSPSTGNSLDLYDEADDSTYAYSSSDDDLFSEATIILDEIDDIDELGAMSPHSYLAPDADVEAANMDSLFENSSQKGTMSDDDDDVAIPKGKIIAQHYMPSKMVCGFIIQTKFEKVIKIQRSFQNFWYMVTSKRYIS